MDAPLFGEEKPMDKAIQYGVGGIVSLFLLLTVIFSVLQGIQENPVHIAFGITLIFLGIIPAVLWKWYRVGDLDPKFKVLIGISIFTLLLSCVVGNIYFWQYVLDVFEECPGGLYAAVEPYNFATRCYTYCDVGFCLDFMSGPPGRCFNCTQGI